MYKLCEVRTIYSNKVNVGDKLALNETGITQTNFQQYSLYIAVAGKCMNLSLAEGRMWHEFKPQCVGC